MTFLLLETKAYIEGQRVLRSRREKKVPHTLTDSNPVPEWKTRSWEKLESPVKVWFGLGLSFSNLHPIISSVGVFSGTDVWNSG